MAKRTNERKPKRGERSFADYKQEGYLWITLATGEYYPDVLPLACELYKPVLVMFGQILNESHSSTDLFERISTVRPQWMRVQLARVFKRYVSPTTPVEMLKKKTNAATICDQFGDQFRRISEVQAAFQSRPLPDEALCALLWEHRDRGRKGYDLTERLFGILRAQFPTLRLIGPERAGKDIPLGKILAECPNPNRPIDFVLFEGNVPLAVGLARYDSDRGGAQEDDRPGQYRECAEEVIRESIKCGLSTKVIFVNDGPGLLLGSMWDDYAYLETKWPNRVKVVTLRMVPERISLAWLRS
jgi:hypothetical protein